MSAPSPPLPAPAGLVLIGYRASGKTTVGRLVADRLARPFVDADAELQRRDGRTVLQVFANGGEAAFRDLEEATLATLCAERPGAVLATGGGAILRGSNRRRLAAHGVVAWLSAPAAVLAGRLLQDAGDRPALTSAGLLDEVSEVLAAREPLYRALADLVVDATPPDPATVAEGLLASLARLGLASWVRR